MYYFLERKNLITLNISHILGVLLKTVSSHVGILLPNLNGSTNHSLINFNQKINWKFGKSGFFNFSRLYILRMSNNKFKAVTLQKWTFLILRFPTICQQAKFWYSKTQMVSFSWKVRNLQIDVGQLHPPQLVRGNSRGILSSQTPLLTASRV